MALFESVRQDLRVAFRVLAKAPGTTALSILSIALGIGLSSGVFSVADAMLLRPIAVREPDGLLALYSRGDDGRWLGYGWLDCLDMQAAGANLAEFTAYQRVSSMLTVGDEREMVLTHTVTPNYFGLLGVRAMVGQASVDMVSGRPQAVLGHRLWQRRFGGDPTIAGRTVLLNGQAFSVAGILPPEFTGPVRGVVTDVWINNDAWFTVLGRLGDQEGRNGQFEIVARLKPGVSPERAAAQLDAAIRGPEKHKPAPKGTTGTILESKFTLNRNASLLIGGGFVLALGLVLFVACANVAQLRLAQAESRKRELGVRMAVGAGGWRVARQLLVESSLVTLAGALLGIALAQGLMQKASEFLSAASPYIDYGIRLDHRVLAFTVFAVMLSVFVSGLAPARNAVRLNISEVLKSEQGATGARNGWQHKFLIAGQVAVGIALLGTAMMFLASLRNATLVRPGLDPHKKLFVMKVSPGWRTDRTTWCDQVCERLAGVAGVRGATYARRLPLSGSGGGRSVRVEIPGAAPMGVLLNNVGGNYFAMLGTRVLAGRGIDASDRAGSGLVAVISQTFARQVFGARTPIGEWLRIDGKMRQVVGVAEDGPSNHLHEDPQPYLWLPYSQSPSGDITLMVETAGEPQALASAIRAELKRYDPKATVYSSQTLKKQMDQALSWDRLTASVAGGLAMFSVLLMGAGLFGVLQYEVNRRTRELGLRMALGARPAEIQRLVLAQSLRMAAWGIPIGLVLLRGAGAGIRTYLVGVTPLDSQVYGFSTLAVLALTGLAAWLPAIRATRVDPLTSLRSE